MKEDTMQNLGPCGKVVGAVITVLLLTANIFAQSTDPSNPTPLTASEIAGGGVEERASYFFTFEGGPGEVIAALEAKMKKDAKGAMVGVELFDVNSKSLASALVSGGLEGGREKLEQALLSQLGKLTSAAASVGSGTKQKTARVKVKAKQPLVLKLTVDRGVESFTLRIGGAVEFGPVQPADGAASPTDATGETGATSADQTTATEETQPTEPPPASDADPPSEPPPPTGEAQPSDPKPKLVGTIVIPGKKKPAVVLIPKKQASPSQQQTPPAKKPAGLKIPGKKQP